MLRKKYTIDQEFDCLLQLTGKMDAELVEIDKILCDDQLWELIKADLSRRYPQTTITGRNSTPVEVILRILALKHLRGLSYEKTLKNINESLVLRQFCRVYFYPLPHKSTQHLN
jgi:IS5 family transposase